MTNSRTKQTCGHPACDRPTRSEWQYSRNKVHRDFCSLFCREDATGADGPQHDNIEDLRKFRQPACCLTCGNSFERRYNYHRSNQRYCSTSCYDSIAARKHGRRNINILTLLAEVGGSEGLTSQDISDYMDLTIHKVRNAAGVSGILRRWVKTGVVQKVPRSGAKLPTYRLCPDWLTSGEPLGTLV